LTERSHTLAKVLFVLGWLGLLAPAMLDGEEVGAKLQVAAIVRAELLETVRSSHILVPAAGEGAARAR